MSDEELLEIAASGDELSAEAEQAFEAELAHRNIVPPMQDERLEVSDEVRDLVVIARYVNLVEAQLAQSALISAGIRAVMWDDNMVRMDWGAIPALGGIRLVVDRPEAAAAQEILNTPAPAATDGGEDEAFESPKCPNCGSAETFLDYSDDPTIERWRCDACDQSWTSRTN